MEIEAVHQILFVTNQELSTRYYQELLGLEPALLVPGMTEFRLANQMVLGLMPKENAGRILNLAVSQIEKSHEAPSCELYLYVKEVTAVYERVTKLGLQIISPLEPRNWGDVAFYLSDPDGHVIAFAQKVKFL